MSLLASVDGGGELWQGGLAALLPKFLQQHRINQVVLAAGELQPQAGEGPQTLGVFEFFLAPLRDTSNMGPEEFAKTKQLANDAADFVAERVLQGKHVLSSCGQGLNRSGLVSGLTLVRLGLEPERAIAAVRSGRPGALGNDLFCRIVLGEV